MARKSIPNDVRQAVLIEAGYRCAVPTCRTILALDLHHVVPVSEDGDNTADNLIALCPNCHALHHRGEISEEAIRVYKGMLVALRNAFDQATIDDLLFLSLQDRPRFFTGDATLQFRRLVAAGLVNVGRGHPRDYRNPTCVETVHKIELTERGQLVMEAWRAGDKHALERALATESGNNHN